MIIREDGEILDDILRTILQGRFKENERLPSESEFVAYYNSPRMNIRKALLKLEDMGYIYSKQGKGRFLKPKKKQIELHLTGSSSFNEKMKNAGYNLTTQNLGYVKLPYDEKIYKKLQVEEDVFKISRLHFIDEEPVVLHISYVSKAMLPEIEKHGDDIQSMFEYYAEQGFTDFTSTKSNISISLPTSIECSLFSCSPLVPLLVVESDCKEKNENKVLEYRKMIYRSDYFSYVITGE